MIPLGALAKLGIVAGAGVELYEAIQRAKRVRPENPSSRAQVEAMDAAALVHQKALCLYTPHREAPLTEDPWAPFFRGEFLPEMVGAIQALRAAQSRYDLEDRVIPALRAMRSRLQGLRVSMGDYT